MSEDKFTPDNSKDDSLNNEEVKALEETRTKKALAKKNKHKGKKSSGKQSPVNAPEQTDVLQDKPEEETSGKDSISDSPADTCNSEGTDAGEGSDISEDIIPSETNASEDIVNSEANASGETPESTSATAAGNKPKWNIYKIIRIICLIGFVIFTALFINEVIIQPYRIKKSIDYTRDLYNRPTEAPTAAASPTQVPVDPVEATPIPQPVEATPTPDPNRDAQGRLLQFKDLLAVNEDVKGWITIPDTDLDYVVMQSDSDDPEYYLDKDINGEYSKAGTLFLDYYSSVDRNTQNLVIHGHNMISTPEKMFHEILDYKKKDLKYYKKHPLISFDTIYNTGKWKIFAVFITTPDMDKEYFFDYRKADFKDSSDFLNFVYQVRIRSLINADTVDINENDQLLMLSTCSYEVNENYRSVVAARKVREGEAAEVDVDSVTRNKNPLYAEDYYSRHGGEAPELAATFEEALANGDIKWYTPPAENTTD
jgi:sortase B